jgi:Flp pilus assembly pilin Flp
MGALGMQSFFLKLYVNAKRMLAHEEAQGLTEYALCFTMIALGTVAGMSAIANSVNHTFIAAANTFTAALH